MSRVVIGTAVRAVAALVVGHPIALVGQQIGDASGRGGRIELVHELAVGSDTSATGYQFAGIDLAAPMRSGSVFVVDASDRQIRKYDSQGRHRGIVGRVGSGPGEYRLAAAIGVLADSLVVVYDPPNGRITLFDTTGAYRRSFPVPPGVVSSSYQDFFVFSDETIALRTSQFDGSLPGGNRAESMYIRLRSNGTVVDSTRVPSGLGASLMLVNKAVGPRWAFPDATVFALLPRGGLATARTTTYRVDVAPAGARPFAIRRPTEPIALDSREREEWEQLVRFVPGRSHGVVPRLPRRKPVIRELLADMEGRIWVGLYTHATRRSAPARATGERRPELTMWEHNAYDLFDERGRYLGRLDFPPDSKLLAVLGNRVWVGRETDESDFVLERYRLSFPTRPR